MSTITFDTLKFAERLEKAGIPREHAKAEAEALVDVFSSGTQELATKTDIQKLELKLDGEMKLVKWMLAATLALVTGIIMLLLRIAFSLPH